MKKANYALLTVLVLTICSCSETQKKSELESIAPIDWSEKVTSLPVNDSLIYGKSYLSVYSQIYSYTAHTSLDLTATVSIRNTSSSDPVYLLKADYFDTHGNPIHSYVDKAIALKEMETLEVVIAEFDKAGGTGANFIFEWATATNVSEPVFEAVMISTYGQQGLSFTTQGKRID